MLWLIPSAVALAALLLYRLLRPRYDFRGKVCFITGGSRGLGLVLARDLVARGAKVAVCSRDPAELERAVHDLSQRGGHVLALPCDITDRAQVNATLARVRAEVGPLDVLIHNAGVIGAGPLEHQTEADFQSSLATHFWAALYLVEAALPDLERQRGRIVTVASFGGKVAVPHLLPYCVGKFALVGYSHGLRAELSQRGVTVTTVCPGLLRTGSHVNARFKGQHEKEYAWFAAGNGIPGFSMNAERAARQILRACSIGDAEVVLTPAAKLGVFAVTVMPNITMGLLAWVNRRILPGPGGIGSQQRSGHQSRGGLPAVVTTLNDQAMRDNNELAEGPDPSRGT